jgi:transcriptional regulator with AAA-type ATPase domain
MLRLVARYGDRIRHFPLPSAEAILGSADGSDMVLPFPGVSGRHARLRGLGREVLLVDLGSKNGLVLAGQRLPWVLLSRGGEVHLGRASLRLEDVASSDAELGIAFSSGLNDAGGSTLPTSSVLLEPAARSAGAALRFLRKLETAGPALGPRDVRLASARVILGAETLLVFRTAGEDVTIAACHGEVPSHRVTRILAQAGADAVAQGEVLAGAGEPGALRLAAVFAARVPADWEEDFFTYLAQRLAGDGPPASDGGPAPEPLLRLHSDMIPGESPGFAALLADLEAAAPGRLDVLLQGETGTGKELLARTLHTSGPNANGPFIALNCAAIPAELLEAELFGVQGRVATGVDPRPGLFVQAQGGTIFLDEIGELAERLQAKLLRALQEREILPLGAAKPRKVDVRVVSASNRDLASLASSGEFRSDLYYRLRGFEIRVPPLRERREDIPGLVSAFAARAAAKYERRILGVSRRALALLMEHSWPGNVRELQDEVERAVLLCPDGGALQSEHFRIAASGRRETPSPLPSQEPPAPAPTLQQRVDDLERQAILDALAASGRNKTRAAQALGLTRNGLNLKLKRLGI